MTRAVELVREALGGYGLSNGMGVGCRAGASGGGMGGRVGASGSGVGCRLELELERRRVGGRYGKERGGGGKAGLGSRVEAVAGSDG